VTQLVGRDAISLLLRRAWTAAGTGRRRLMLLAGEPGIGKTALAAELTDHVTGRGDAAAWGVCVEAGGVPAFWPWPEIVDRLGGTMPPSPGDREAAWFEVATTVVRTVRQVSPALVVLDDLQWAGPGALRVLEFAARQLVRDRVLVLGTYRDTDVGPDHPLGSVLGSAEVITLTGLAADEVARVLDGVPGAVGLADGIHRRTGGNPFFVEQIAQLLTTGGPGSEHRVPAAVGEAIGRRMARLPQPTVALLDLAAVDGNDVDVAVLARAAGRAVVDVIAALAPAVGARILRPAGAVGRYRFEHDLYRETRLDTLDDEGRARAHAAYAHALESDPAAPAVQIAYHYARAVPVVDPARARLRVERGAEAATAHHSHEEAARLRRDAVRLAELDGPVPPRALLDLGDALLAAGEPDPAKLAYQRAADLAVDDAELRARAALGLHRAGVTSGEPRTGLVALLESVNGRLAGAAAARVRAALARELADGPGADPRRAASLAAAAVDEARANGDPGLLAACLFAQHDVEWLPGSAAKRLGLLSHIIEAADAAGDELIAGEGVQLRFAALAELGDPSTASALDDLVGRAERSRQPRLRYLAASRQAAYTLLTGSTDEAARLAEAARELGEATGEPDTYGVYVTQMVAIELARGGPSGMGAALRAAGGPIMPPEMLPHQRMFELLAAGEKIAAGALLRATTTGGEASMFRWRAVARATLEVEIAVAAGAADVCPVLYRYLRPHASQLALIGGAVVILPPVDLQLGLAAAAGGEPRAAAGHFRAAAEIAERLGARGYAVRARVELAAAEAEAAAGLRALAEVADELGHSIVRDRALGLLATEPPYECVFHRRGAVWTLSFDGHSAQVPDAKGLHDLARLLAVPGQEISAQELAGDPVPDTGADEVLDERAKAAYKARLTQLDADIDEATADHDEGRLSVAVEEREALIAVLAEAYGLGGRPRRLKDPAERARVAVTARIREAIKRIRPIHPALAEHLSTGIQTGRRCCYRPRSPMRWTL